MTNDTLVVDSHNTAAHEHENAAKSHRAAAEQYSKGSHDAYQQHAKAALDHSVKAQAASRLTLEKPAVAVAGAAKH